MQGPRADRGRDRMDRPGARNSWSSRRQEEKGSSELQKAGNPADTFEFPASVKPTTELCHKLQQLSLCSSKQEATYLAPVTCSVLAKWSSFLEAGVLNRPSVLLSGCCGVR